MMTLAQCTTCRGRGQLIEEPCHECRGAGRLEEERQLSVEIPAGVDSGTRLRLAGRGGAGEGHAPPGDLYVEMHVQPDERFVRNGENLTHRVRLGIAEYLAQTLDDRRFDPPELLRRMVADGDLGRKSGRGFYRWDDAGNAHPL